MRKKAFTHAYYINILGRLKQSGRNLCNIADFFTHGDHNAAFILRHDVDRWPQQSIRLAHLEHEHGIRSTYYFRATREGDFDTPVVKEIADLGHEVGYHYETYALCRGDRRMALDLFANNLKTFRQIAPCVTVSMHGSPLSSYDNLELLRDINLQDYGLVADATLSFSGLNVIYYTDTGGSWNTNDVLNRRDRIPSSTDIEPEDFLFESDAFTQLLHNYPVIIYMNTHPERWAHNSLNSFICRFRDMSVNLAKQFLIPATRYLRR